MSENTDRSKRSKQEKMFEDSTNIRSGGLPVSELVSWFRGPWTGRRIRRVIASLIGIYLFFVVITIWCPPVRGIVVDAQTGKRIAGVQVHLQSRGVSLLGVEAGNMVLWGKMLKTTTGADGRFSFRGNAARSRLDEGSFLDVFSPFQWITRVQLTVWAPGYGTRIISMPSYFFLPWWAETNVSRKWSANRLRIPVWGFRTKILIDKPSGEEEWRKQCDFTIFAKEEGFASDSWVFNDLTGYLHRWPQGKKARKYFESLLGTGLIDSCQTLQEDWDNGKIKRSELEAQLKRSKTILSLHQKVAIVKEPIAAYSEQREIELLMKTVPCAEKLLQKANQEKGR